VDSRTPLSNFILKKLTLISLKNSADRGYSTGYPSKNLKISETRLLRSVWSAFGARPQERGPQRKPKSILLVVTESLLLLSILFDEIYFTSLNSALMMVCTFVPIGAPVSIKAEASCINYW